MSRHRNKKRVVAPPAPPAAGRPSALPLEPPAIVAAPRRSFYRRLISDPRIYPSLALVLSLAFLYRHLASAGELPAWINSDTLWPVNLITDLFVDRYPLNGWQFSIAPCWFPDVFLTGVAYLFTRNVVSATLGAGFLQFSMLVGGVVFCWSNLRFRGKRAAAVLTIITGVAITLYTAFHPLSGYGAFHQFFLPQMHTGDLVNTIWALGLALCLLHTTGARTWPLVFYPLVCFLGTMSDMLFLAHFLAPVTLAVISLRLIDRRPARSGWLIGGWIAAFAGYICNRFLLHATDVSAQAGFGWATLKTALLVFLRGASGQVATGDFLQLLAIAWLAACAIASIVFLRRYRRKRDSGDALMAVFFVTACAASAGSAAAVILGGSTSLTGLQSYGITMRYLHPMFLLPLFAWPVLIAMSQRVVIAIRRPVFIAGASSLALAGLLLATSQSAGTPLERYSPAMVRELDAYCKNTGLKYGYAGYWQARLITLLSNSGLRVYQVDRNLRPHHWVNNLHWYSEAVEDRKRPPLFSFAILQDPGFNLQEGDVTSLFGSGGQKISVGGVPALIYLQRTSEARARRCSADAAFVQDRMEFTGSCLDAGTGQTAGGEWSARQPADMAGVALMQFAGRIPRGRYSLQVDYSATGPDNQAIEVGYPSGAVLLSEPLPSGTRQFHATFLVASRIEDPGMRIFYSGVGALDVRRITLRRLAAAVGR